MKSITIRIKIDNIPVEIKVNQKTNYRVLKEYLRDTLCPIVKAPQNWGRIIEIIRDNAIPHLQ